MKRNQIYTATGQPVKRRPIKTAIWNYRGLYLMILPVLIYVLIIYYWPMLGIRYSFYDYTFRKIEFVGLKHFRKMFADTEFWRAFTNTLVLSVAKLLMTTLTAVIVSVFINEMMNPIAQKFFQTVIYLPHFLSWTVTAAIFTLFLSLSWDAFLYLYVTRRVKKSVVGELYKEVSVRWLRIMKMLPVVSIKQVSST
ncbi:MAG: hypothetical protein K6E53_12865 [Lachnospiraceae bacterium]|nr:hypothetical protein [Lachnospiraceae bacterium]